MYVSIEISLKFVPGGQINNIPALVQIMAWRRPGNKPLSEAMMVSLLTHICVTRQHWVNFDLGHGQIVPLNQTAVEVMEWMDYVIPLFYWDVGTYSFLLMNVGIISVTKRGRWVH